MTVFGGIVGVVVFGAVLGRIDLYAKSGPVGPTSLLVAIIGLTGSVFIQSIGKVVKGMMQKDGGEISIWSLL